MIVHIASVWVPFTSESKEAIAHYPEIIKELRLGLQECGRKIATHIRKRRREADELKKRAYIEKYIPQVAIGLEHILGSRREAANKVRREPALGRAREAAGRCERSRDDRKRATRPRRRRPRRKKNDSKAVAKASARKAGRKKASGRPARQEDREEEGAQEGLRQAASQEGLAKKAPRKKAAAGRRRASSRARKAKTI